MTRSRVLDQTDLFGQMPPDLLTELSGREVLTILEDEVGRLPSDYRMPVVLCCLEGLTLEEASVRLGCSPGALRGRLERGRARLRERLVRRGLVPAAHEFQHPQ